MHTSIYHLDSFFEENLNIKSEYPNSFCTMCGSHISAGTCDKILNWLQHMFQPMKMEFLVVSHSPICTKHGPEEFTLNFKVLVTVESKQCLNRFPPISDAQHMVLQGTSMKHTPQYAQSMTQKSLPKYLKFWPRETQKCPMRQYEKL